MHLLSFLSNNDFLISCGINENSPVLLHRVSDLTLLVSTQINDIAIDLFPITNYVGDFFLDEN